MLRRVVVTAVAVLATLSISAPAFAQGVGDLVNQVLNSCQNIKDGDGSCP